MKDSDYDEVPEVSSNGGIQRSASIEECNCNDDFALAKEMPSDNAQDKKYYEDLEREEREQEVEAAKLRNRGTAITNLERECNQKIRLSVMIVVGVFVFTWIGAVCRLVWDCSLITGGKHHVSDAVLVALVSGISANLLTLLILIIKYLFPASEKQ